MRFPLRLSTSTNAGSFQRDSALWSSHLEYSVTMPLGRSTGVDSVSTRSAGCSRFLRVGTPWQVIAATASASMTGWHHVPSPEPSDAIGSRYSVFPQSAPWPLERSALQGQPRKALPAHYPRLHTYPRIVGRFHKGGDLSWLPRKVRVAKPPAGLEPATLQSPIFLGRSTY